MHEEPKKLKRKRRKTKRRSKLRKNASANDESCGGCCALRPEWKPSQWCCSISLQKSCIIIGYVSVINSFFIVLVYCRSLADFEKTCSTIGEVCRLHLTMAPVARFVYGLGIAIGFIFFIGSLLFILASRMKIVVLLLSWLVLTFLLDCLIAFCLAYDGFSGQRAVVILAFSWVIASVFFGGTVVLFLMQIKTERILGKNTPTLQNAPVVLEKGDDVRQTIAHQIQGMHKEPDKASVPVGQEK